MNMPMKENAIEPTGEAKDLSLKAQRASESEPAAGLGDVLVPVAKALCWAGCQAATGEKWTSGRQLATSATPL